MLSRYTTSLFDSPSPIPSIDALNKYSMRLISDYEVTSIFIQARGQLIYLYNLAGLSPPQGLLDLADKISPAPDNSTCVSSLITPKLDASIVQLEPSLTLKSDGSSSDESSLTQFCNSVNKLASETSTLTEDTLNALMPDSFFGSVLTQIPHDYLELRRLYLFQYYIVKLCSLCKSSGLTEPANLYESRAQFRSLFQNAFQPAFIPEMPIICSKKPESIVNREEFLHQIGVSLVTFDTSLKSLSEEEASVLKLMVGDFLFELVRKNYFYFHGCTISNVFMTTYFKDNQALKETDIFFNLIECSLNLSSSSASSAMSKSPSKQESKPAPYLTSPKKDDEIYPKDFDSFFEDDEIYPKDFDSFTFAITYIEKRDLRSTLVYFNELTQHYKKSLEIPKLPDGIKKEIQEFVTFFELISGQLQILMDPDPLKQATYQANLTELVGYREHVEENGDTFDLPEEMIENLTTFLEKLISFRPCRFPREISAFSLSHFKSFEEALAAMERGNLSEALTHSNNIIKYYEYSLDIRTSSPETLKLVENLTDFFCLVSDQLKILQEGNLCENDLYDTNLSKLSGYNSDIQNYFRTYGPREEITKNLTAFLEGLDLLKASTILSGMRPLKKQRE